MSKAPGPARETAAASPACPLGEPSSFLIVRMSALGDILNALPVLVALRRRFPKAKIGWMIEDRFASALEGHPYIDELLVVPLKKWWKDLRKPAGFVRGLRELLSLRKRLRASHYEVLVDIHAILKSSLVAMQAGCKHRLVLSDARFRLHATVKVPCVQGVSAVRWMAVADYLGAPNPDYDACFFMREEDHAWAESLLAEHDFGCDGPLIALNPGASAPWRQWPAESFAAVARILQERRGARIVILGSASETPLAEAIAAQCPDRPLVCAGKSTIRGLGALLMPCDLLITADTGPMHLAAALRTPTVSFFGSSSPAKTGPIGDFHSIIVAPGPDCVPCDNRPNCQPHPPAPSPAAERQPHPPAPSPLVERGRTAGSYPCLARITPEMIAEAAIERLSLPRPAPPTCP